MKFRTERLTRNAGSARNVLAAAVALAFGTLHFATTNAESRRADPPRSRQDTLTTLKERFGASRGTAHGALAPNGGTYWPVTNCADSGEGSMRAAVESAVSGDTIEAIGLSCATVTLSSAIVVDVDDLTIEGAGAEALTVTNGAKYGRVFTHTGHGTLQLLGMTVSSGVVSPNSAEADSRGGCIFSEGAVALGDIFESADARHGVVVRDCTAVSTEADVRALGGGIFATSGVGLTHSIVSGCRAVAQDDASRADGGGVYLAGGGAFVMKYSEVRDNAAEGAVAISGGIDAPFASDMIVSHSTIAGNSAGNRAGGAYLGTEFGNDVYIDNTTISGNVSDGESGLVVNVRSSNPYGTIHMSSVTLTANTSTNAEFAALIDGPLVLNASIISGNGGGDLFGVGDDAPEGADNVIGDNSSGMPSAGLLVSDDPKLAPLASNGGFTRTHAERPDSPAIDAGNTAGGGSTDQRGFARVVGARADIGAYERDPDVIFASDFD
jgi:hypothetical protein